MKLIYNRYQVSYFGNHPEYLRSSLMFYNLTYSFQAQSIERSFLNCGTFDSAFYLFDFNGFHIVVLRSLSFKYFFERHATVLSHGICITQFAESSHGSFHKVVRV